VRSTLEWTCLERQALIEMPLGIQLLLCAVRSSIDPEFSSYLVEMPKSSIGARAGVGRSLVNGSAMLRARPYGYASRKKCPQPVDPGHMTIKKCSVEKSDGYSSHCRQSSGDRPPGRCLVRRLKAIRRTEPAQRTIAGRRSGINLRDKQRM
jgi:hypothetical protein